MTEYERPSFSEYDVDELNEIADSLRAFMERHPTEMTMPILGALIAATTDIEQAERYIQAVR